MEHHWSLSVDEGEHDRLQRWLADHRCHLTLQTDGNAFVCAASGAPVWFDGRYGTARPGFQADANLVAHHSSSSRAVGDTETWRAGPSRQRVQDDGDAVIHRDDNGRAVWCSGWDTGRWASDPTSGRRGPPAGHLGQREPFSVRRRWPGCARRPGR